MINNSYRVLGYYKLLDILSTYAACPLGQSDCLSLNPLTDPEQIDNELRRVAQMRLLIKTQGFVSMQDVTDVVMLLKKSMAAGACLEPVEFLCIWRLVETGLKIKKFIKQRRALFSNLYEISNEIPDLENLISILKRTISQTGVIHDSASPALKKIRAGKIRLRQALEKKLDLLKKTSGVSGDRQENLTTIRDGRFVIALRSDQKPRIQGIIHDYSQTRATCYMEPMEVIQDNNRAAELEQEEKAEEFRILQELTRRVRDLAPELELTRDIVSRMDGIYARACFGEAQSCIMPEIGSDFGISLKGARNPLLLAMSLAGEGGHSGDDFPTPVDIVLERDRNALIISGPNRGGKTVTLKTLGLMSLMTQSGVHIPAKESSCLPVFDQVMADIGDDQDIQAGQSTFSAHALHLKKILEMPHSKSLVIIDEPGMGTDPDEGVALSMAVLDILTQQGAFVAVSTHSNRLKAYGMTNPQAMNAAVGFDDTKRRSTYKVVYGVPGISHALDVAQEIGVSSKVLDRAKSYLDKDEIRLNQLIDKMNVRLKEAEQKTIEATALKEKHRAAAIALEQKLDLVEQEKNEVIEAKKKEAETAIREAKETLNQAVNLLKKEKKRVQGQVMETHSKASAKLLTFFDEHARKNDEKSYINSDEFKKGQTVFHKILKQNGIIQSIKPSDGRVSLLLGTLKITAHMGELERISDSSAEKPKKSPVSISWNIQDTQTRELNVIGFRVDEAIPLIDKTIDRALVEGDLTLRIIHGFGSGILRDAIRGHLKEFPFVKKVSGAEPKYGGDAITLVEL